MISYQVLLYYFFSFFLCCAGVFVFVNTAFWVCVPEHSIGFLDSHAQHVLSNFLLNQ